MLHLQKSILYQLAVFPALLTAIPACSSLAPPGPSLLSPAEMQTAIAGTAQALQTNTLPSNVRSSQDIDEPTPTPTDTQTATDTAEPTATFEPTPTETVQASSLPPCIPDPSQYEIGIVTHVVYGDTIDAVINGQEHRIGYIGMIAPDPTTGLGPFGEEAKAANQELVEGKIVTLYKDVSDTDLDGRELRFVFVEDLFVNDELIRKGYALVTTLSPDAACEGYFLEIQQAALAAGAGLWGAPTPTATVLPTNTSGPTTQPPPSSTPQPQPTAQPQPTQPSNCSPAYPTVCIPPPPPDLDCGDIPYRRFQVLAPDPHRFDGDHNGIGCEN